MIVLRKYVVAFGVHRLDVVAESIVEILRDLLLGRVSQIRGIQEDNLLRLIAIDVVFEPREVSTWICLTTDVLSPSPLTLPANRTPCGVVPAPLMWPPPAHVLTEISAEEF